MVTLDKSTSKSVSTRDLIDQDLSQKHDHVTLFTGLTMLTMRDHREGAHRKREEAEISRGQRERGPFWNRTVHPHCLTTAKREPTVSCFRPLTSG
jgi:hypothetical protein